LVQVTPYTIYNASAGSGKTFTLVKEYLKIVLTSEYKDYYKYILGITFTNKAVAEMKQRIINQLVLFSKEKSISEIPTMMSQISAETKLSPKVIHLNSRRTLNHLLHHYAYFSIETIDHFNHRLIRTFAKDMKLSGNFEVNLETDLINELAVEQLLNKAGKNESITKVLVDFALEKTDDDKSWDISKDIANTSIILFKENEVDNVAELKKYTLSDFMKFKSSLKKKKKEIGFLIQKQAELILQLLESEGLSHKVFQYNMLSNHLLKLMEGNYVNNDKLQKRLEEGGFALYKKNTPEQIIIKIDAITPYLLEQYLEIKNAVSELLLVQQFIKSITPLSVIHLVNQEIEKIKEEQNILPISEFNTLIQSEIKDQPAPFIYERLGEKYRHFFIDEFQDTSRLQWDNLIPLIDNAVSQQYGGSIQGSLMLVGDAKQSIYRWRGGLPEQFMSLYHGSTPFMMTPEVLTLNTNYRSYEQIIDFNNSFFEFVSKHFGDRQHSELYRLGSDQMSNENKGGYVKFQFIDKSAETESLEVYSQLILDTIINLREKGFNDCDICILTRKKKEGIAIGQFLIKNNIPIISTETLLLNQSDLVNFLINALRLSVNPENDIIKLDLLYFLYTHFNIKEDKHKFFKAFVGCSLFEFTILLKKYNIEFNLDTMNSFSIYEGCEYCIRQFGLNSEPDAYLLGFMDHVFEFNCKPKNDKISFLNNWEIKKDSLSIALGESHNAVKIMTIHKAKGLEFKVVLFPFADVNIYYEKDASVWFPVSIPDIDLTMSRIRFNKEILTYGEEGERIYESRRNKLELDNLNLLYVTLTRAVEQLYVFTEKPKNSSSNKLMNYSHYFRAYLEEMGLWNESQLIYNFGKSEKTISDPDPISDIISEKLNYLSHSPAEHGMKIFNKKALLWETDAEERIEFGNHIHHVMEQVISKEDVPILKEEIRSQKVISDEMLNGLFEIIESMVLHPELGHYFSPSLNIVNERDIITKEGEVLRPDRVVFQNDNNVTILDYKTGEPNKKHKLQIDKYAEAFLDMGYRVKEKLLVYCSTDKIEINKA
jgi:ATP-dependent exoDNAse (exonuclease V) beta subunit